MEKSEGGHKHARHDGRSSLLCQRSSKPVYCCQNDGKDGGSHARNDRRKLRQRTERHIQLGEHNCEEDRWGDETHAGDNQSPPATAEQPYVNRHLRGVGTGNEVRNAEEVQEVFVRDPSSSLDDFVLEHGDMGGRTAERRQSKFQE